MNDMEEKSEMKPLQKIAYEYLKSCLLYFLSYDFNKNFKFVYMHSYGKGNCKALLLLQ